MGLTPAKGTGVDLDCASGVKAMLYPAIGMARFHWISREISYASFLARIILSSGAGTLCTLQRGFRVRIPRQPANRQPGASPQTVFARREGSCAVYDSWVENVPSVYMYGRAASVKLEGWPPWAGDITWFTTLEGLQHSVVMAVV